MLSPRGETNPSLIIDYYNDELVWRDMGYDIRPADAVNFVIYMESLRGNNMTYQEALRFILEGIPDYEHSPVIRLKKKNRLKIRYRITYEDYELDYWRSQKIPLEILLAYRVYPCEIWNSKLWYYSNVKDPVFCYLFDSETPIWKAYRPLAKTTRFISKNTKDHIQGYDMLFDHDTCIITKSYKDVMTYALLGYPAVAPHSENILISPDHIRYLTNRYQNVILNFDNDEAGIRGVKQYQDLYGLPYFYFSEYKDITEYHVCTIREKIKSVIAHAIRKSKESSSRTVV